MEKTTKAWAIVMKPQKGSVDSGGPYDVWRTQGKYWMQNKLEPWNDGERTMLFRTRKEARELIKLKFDKQHKSFRRVSVARVEVQIKILRIENER